MTNNDSKWMLLANIPIFIGLAILLGKTFIDSRQTIRETDMLIAESEKAQAEWEAQAEANAAAEAAAFEEFSAASIRGRGVSIDFPPDADDKSTWAYAYRLLHPDHDRSERANTAIKLITRDRELSDIPPRELSLLYTAYNELGDDNQQFNIAMQLWKKAPGTHRALEMLASAMHWRYSGRRQSAPVIEFVDQELTRGNSGERELLLLKASAMLWKEDPSEEDKAAVRDVIVAAFKFETVQDPTSKYEFIEPPENLVNYTEPFSSTFTDEEKEDLLRRIKEALPKAERQLREVKVEAEPNE